MPELPQINSPEGSESSEPLDFHERNLLLFETYIPAKDLIQTIQEDPGIYDQLGDSDRRLFEHGKQAYEDLIHGNTGLVVFHANRHKVSLEERDELIQIGMISLIEAVQDFDPDLGYKFSTFATSKIRPALAHARNEKFSPLSLPRQLRADIIALRAASREINDYHGRQPTTEELSLATGFSEDKIQKLERIKIEVRALSLDKRMSDEARSKTLGEMVIASSNAEDDELQQRVGQLLEDKLSQLSERDRTIVELRLGINDRPVTSLRSIGDIVGLTRQGVKIVSDRFTLAISKVLESEFGPVADVADTTRKMTVKIRGRKHEPLDVSQAGFSEKLADLSDRQKKLIWLFFDQETGEQIRTPGEVHELLGVDEDKAPSARSLRTYLYEIRSEFKT
ncbi:TPA: sigma-70 family RNA polymerase sigma factor [Candidatus Saccharibacteria bacterium]|nr:sigma-70 family RNA polymerase sigma factor [Candidatus Saccharibacteria bacterium]HIO87754.1 sigma-70 family RNA polymerase sigma factor [Candidatus Saccharibacteria bacterium]